jgi:hypothetical protein
MAASITCPFNCWMGLQVAGVEVSGVGYVRRPATFVETAEAGFAANAASVQWPACGSDWGLVDTVNLYDALTGGNLLCTEQATSVVRGNPYDVLRVSASGYQVYNAPIPPRGFGTLTWGVGRYATNHSLVPPNSGLGSPYDVGGYGVGPYEMEDWRVLLLRTFGTVALCGNQPGVWAPGPFDVVAVS